MEQFHRAHSPSSRFHPRAKTTRRSGFSLIEVMVALIIFVVGALAIVRIFPGALAVVQTSETRTIATRMAQSTLARFESQPFSVPEAIYDYDSGLGNPGNFSDFEGAVVGTSTTNSSLPSAPPRLDMDDLPVTTQTYNGKNLPVSQSALGRFRRVSGEKRLVSDAAGTYVMTRFPFVANSITAYRDRDIEGVRVNNSIASGRLDFTDATMNGQSISEPANPNRIDVPYRAVNQVFYVSYRYIDGGRIHGVTDEPITFPAGVWDDTTSARVLQSFVGRQIVEGPVKLRYRQPIGLVTTPGNAIRGFVRFDTADANTPQRGDIVSLDYIVSDWRWLVTDGVPSIKSDPRPDTALESYRSLDLTSRNLLDEEIPASSANPFKLPLYALMLGTDASGAPQSPAPGDWNGQYPDTQVVAEVDRKTGRVLFDTTQVATPFIAPRARVVYRNADGWAHQISVAAQSYVPFEPNAIGPTPLAPANEHPREPWREYFRAPNTRFLLFHPSEAGKTVLVSFEYLDGTNYRRVTDAMVTISDTLVDYNPLPNALRPNGFLLGTFKADTTPAVAEPPQRVAIAELSDFRGYLIGTDPSLTGNGAPKSGGTVTAITAVKGASIRARTAWFEGERYSQAAVSSYRATD